MTNDVDKLFQVELDEALIHFDKKLEDEVAQLLSLTKSTLSIAEAITGAAVSQRLSQHPISQKMFLGGIICTQVLALISLCGVSATTLKREGSMGSKLGLEMARGVQVRTKSKLGISTCGNIQCRDKKKRVYIGKMIVSLVWDRKEEQGIYDSEGTKEFIINQFAQSTLIFLRDVLRSKGRV